MTRTLDVKLNFTPNPPPNATHFYYSVSYTDPTNGVTYTGEDIQNKGTVAFVEDGNYTLQDSAGNSTTFTFDALVVSKDEALGDSLSCGDCEPYDLGDIAFLELGGAETVMSAYEWCQGLPSSFASMRSEQRGRVVDPKLGVSNTKGGTEQLVSETEFGDCDCDSCN